MRVVRARRFSRTSPLATSEVTARFQTGSWSLRFEFGLGGQISADPLLLLSIPYLEFI